MKIYDVGGFEETKTVEYQMNKYLSSVQVEWQPASADPEEGLVTHLLTPKVRDNLTQWVYTLDKYFI